MIPSKPHKADLTLDGKCLRLSGIIDKHNVPDLYIKSQQIDAEKHVNEVCLDSVEHIDSAGLALLLEWRSWSKTAGKTLKLSNAPKQLRMLAHLSQLEETLGLDNI